MVDYDTWKTTDPNDTGSVEDACPKGCKGCPECKPEPTFPVGHRHECDDCSLCLSMGCKCCSTCRWEKESRKGF